MIDKAEIERLADLFRQRAENLLGNGNMEAGTAYRQAEDDIRALAARCDQPAGEPVPLPKPGVADADGKPFAYWPDQLRTHREEYAETVRKQAVRKLAELHSHNLRRMLERAETAERERDAEKAFAEDYRAQLQQAISERDEARRDAARFVWQFNEWQKPQSPHNQAVLAAYRADDIDAVRAAIDSAMGDSIEGRGDG